jgi:nucleotide-binding universal stress UspA family protein
VINTILTGVDDSETAAVAARKAAELASVHDAELHVISAYGNQEVRTLRAGGDVLQINQVDKATQVAKDVADSLRAEFPNLTITSNAALGQPGEALVSTAAELNADLIVVGNKRVQGFTRVLGSVARDVASEAHCDVYIAYTR